MTINYLKIAGFFRVLTKIDVRIYEKNGTACAEKAVVSLPETMRTVFSDHLATLKKEAFLLENGTALEVPDHTLFVNFTVLKSRDSTHTAILGPYVYDGLSSIDLQSLMRTFGIAETAENRSGILKTWRDLPHNPHSAKQTADLFYTLLNHGADTLVHMESLQKTTQEKESVIQNREKKEADIDYQYMMSDRLRRAIRKGEKDHASWLVTAFPERFSYRSDRQSLWHVREIAIVVGTIARESAHDAGVNPSVLAGISEKYFYQVRDANDASAIEALIHDIVEQYCEAVNALQENRYSSLVQKALSLMEQHYDNSLTLEMIAKDIPCHPVYLSQRFRKETGMTVNQKLTEIRMENAEILLKNSSIPITEIAERTGYESYSRFSTVFKKAHGCTCRQWRQKQRSSS
jgi:AraC-like DNA-binding protein